MSNNTKIIEKIIETLKSRDVTIPRVLLYKYKALGLDDQEFIILTYLLNTVNSLYNPLKISKNLNIDVDEVLMIISNLSEKGFLKTTMIERDNKKAEIVKLDQLYEKIAFLLISESKEEDTTIYSVFEKEFGRPLTSLEVDIIRTWQDSAISNEIIIEALKEATFNGVSNLKYIDKILTEWGKKGIKTKEDVEKNRKKFKEQKSKNIQKDVFSYDWLSDEE